MADRIAYRVYCDRVVGVRTVVELREVRLRSRWLLGAVHAGSELLYRREFGPEDYEEADHVNHELDKTAAAMEAGEYGWQVVVDARGSSVRVRLISRVFDGRELRVDIAQAHEVDQAEPGADVRAAELRAELLALAEQRNEELWRITREQGSVSEAGLDARRRAEHDARGYAEILERLDDEAPR